MISLLVLCACALPQGPGSTGGRGGPYEKRIEAVAKELAGVVAQRRPWIFVERGIPRGPGQRVGRYGPSATAWWQTSIDGLRVRMTEVLRSDLTPEWLARYEAVDGWIEMETVLTLSRSPERWDAASYVERVERVLLLTFHAAWLDPAERWTEIERILTELPPFWSAAQHGLVAPLEEWTDEAIQRLVDLENFMEIDLRIELEEVGRDPRGEKFEKTLNQAVQKTREFRQWLLGKPASVGGSVTILGPDNWLALVRAVTGTRRDIGSIKTSLLREIAALERQRGDDWRPRVPSEEELDPKRIAAGIRAASRKALQVALDAKLIEVDQPERLEILPTVARGPASLGPLPLFVGRKAEQQLLIEPENSDWPPAVSATRASLFTPEAQVTLGVRFGFPGEALLRWHLEEDANPIQGILVNRSILEGWGLYALDWIQRVDWVENPFREDESFGKEAVRAQMLEAIRLLASLEVHAEGVSPSEAAETFRRRTGFDIATATQEIRYVLKDPLVGIGYLGEVELLERERQLAREVDAQTALRRTLAAVLAQPMLRPAGTTLAAVSRERR